MWDDVVDIYKSNYWYWGYIHLGIVYGDGSYAGGRGVNARCIGHSAIPFSKPTGIKADTSIIIWLADTPLDSTEMLNLPEMSYRAKNGFAVITLLKNSLSEKFYDEGNTHPVWPTWQFVLLGLTYSDPIFRIIFLGRDIGSE